MNSKVAPSSSKRPSSSLSQLFNQTRHRADLSTEDMARHMRISHRTATMLQNGSENFAAKDEVEQARSILEALQVKPLILSQSDILRACEPYKLLAFALEYALEELWDEIDIHTPIALTREEAQKVFDRWLGRCQAANFALDDLFASHTKKAFQKANLRIV
ncbi:MAG: hypothetical protein EOP04_03595 [Proteobacteria bacterium]|nr:MAG: hypothetical protein EOP04_03595 [Pseudomonadota bacterium]